MTLRESLASGGPSSRPSCVRRVPSSGRRQHGRVDRHVSRRPRPDARGHLRVPHRQRRRVEGRRQPAAPRDQPGDGRPAIARRALSDVQAPARLLPELRGPRAPARLRCAGGARGGQERRRAALRGARVGVERADPAAGAVALARRLGEPARRSGGPGRATCWTSTRPPSSTSRRSSRITAATASSNFSRRPGAGAGPIPGMFGLFYYRSANAKTLEVLSSSCPYRSRR
jgi:hypothetical protein